jgi:hypothetical protein
MVPKDKFTDLNESWWKWELTTDKNIFKTLISEYREKLKIFY